MIRVYTFGHSTRPLDEFLAVLTTHAICTIADVRRFPGSRRYPHFARAALSESLTTHGIDYVWMPELGGKRTPQSESRNDGWKNTGFRGYADYMETDAFRIAVERLMECARKQLIAFLCAEAAWRQCHRALIADYLKAHGWDVAHIIDRATIEPHIYTTPARITNGKLSYASPLPVRML